MDIVMDTAIDLNIHAWVRWDHSPSQRTFPVRIGSTETVSSLKKLIFSERQNGVLRGIDPAGLTLWKLTNPIPFEGVDERVDSLPYYLAEVAENLPAIRFVGDYFTKSTSHLHIIAEKPISCEQRILTDFWHTLWYHDHNVSPQIPFYERHTVQRDGSRPDIALPLKCWTLQLPMNVAEQLAFDVTTFLVRDDYMEALKELFLSVGWAEPPLPETLDSVDEFRNPFLDRLEKMPWNRSAFVMTGHPGIGKSIWLLIILVLRLNARLPTIYQSEPDYIIFFYGNGLQISNNLRSLLSQASHIPDRVWALVDSNQELKTVHSLYISSKIFVVQTPSPRIDRLKWTQKVLYTLFFLRPWSQSEILCARNFQRSLCSESQLTSFIMKYGPSARLAYSYSHLPEVYESELRSALANVSREDLTRLVGDTHARNLQHDVSHRIFVVHPADPRYEATLQLASHHVRDLLVETWEEKTQESATSLYSLYIRNPSTKSFAGLLLEPLVHDILHKGGVWGLAMMKKGTGPNNVLWSSPDADGPKAELRISADGFSIKHHTADAADSSTSSSSSIAFHPFSNDTILRENGYYKPTGGSQATFDAFLYDAKDKHATLIQVRVSEQHGVKKEGFEQLKTKGVQTFSYVAVTPPKGKLQLSFPKAEEETWPETQGWYRLDWII